MSADLEFEGPRSASFSEAEGLLVVRDRELFRPGFEGFCRRLADSAAGLGGVRSAFVCLASGTCRIEFEGGRFSAPEMAEWFAESVRTAVASGQPTEPGRGAWISLTRFSAEHGGATWETTRERRGSIRFRNPDLAFDRDVARQVASGLLDVPGVISCRVSLWGGRDLNLKFNPEQIRPAELLSLANDAFLRSLQPAPARLEVQEAAIPAVATGLQRVGYLALAAGSFGLTVVGLVIPGVPTVPFLLATSYFLVRSSPSLNEKLLRSKFFGPIVSDLEFGHGLRRINKIKLIAFSLTIPLVTILLFVPSGPILLVMLIVTSVGLFAITRIPGLPGGSEPVQPPRLRLLTA